MYKNELPPNKHSHTTVCSGWARFPPQTSFFVAASFKVSVFYQTRCLFFWFSDEYPCFVFQYAGCGMSLPVNMNSLQSLCLCHSCHVVSTIHLTWNDLTNNLFIVNFTHVLLKMAVVNAWSVGTVRPTLPPVALNKCVPSFDTARQ